MADPLHALVRVLASAAGEAIVDGPDDKARLVELVREEMARTPSPLTIGEALAAETIIEYRTPDGRWWQRRTGGSRRGWFVPVPGDGEAIWTEWRTLGLPPSAECRWPCRLIPLAAADADPASRGPL